MSCASIPRPFPLLKLPPEIRNSIWRYVVVSNEVITFFECMCFHKCPKTRLRVGAPIKMKSSHQEPRQTSLLAVAFTCRQLYHEVTPLYYAENLFRPKYANLVLKSSWELQRFADAIGRKNAAAITQLHLWDPFWTARHRLEPSMLPNLKRVYFDKCTALPVPHSLLYHELTSYAKNNTHLTIVYDEEEWGPEKWELYPEWIRSTGP